MIVLGKLFLDMNSFSVKGIYRVSNIQNLRDFKVALIFSHSMIETIELWDKILKIISLTKKSLGICGEGWPEGAPICHD